MALTRDAGPVGWVDLDPVRPLIDGWELFEGDPDSPHLCRGWFRCSYAEFSARKGDRLRLELHSDEGDERILDVEIVRASTTEPVWEFVAEP